jgi:hypothetical protein
VRLLDRGLEVRLHSARPDELRQRRRSSRIVRRRSRAASTALLKMRLDATIHPGRQPKTKHWADDLDVDRGCIHSPKDRIRALVSFADCVRLLDRGLEIRLYRAHRYGPLDPALIMSDQSFRQWLDGRVSTLKANPGPKPFVER